MQLLSPSKIRHLQRPISTKHFSKCFNLNTNNLNGLHTTEIKLTPKYVLGKLLKYAFNLGLV